MHRAGFPRTIAAAIVLACALGAPAAAQLGKDDVGRYEPAFKALESGRWTKALRLVRGAEQRLPAKFIRWLQLSEQGSGASFAAIAEFAAENPAWPGTDTLRRRAEEAIDHRVSDTRILAWFAANAPISTDGRIAYAAALLRSGDQEAATALLREAWIEGTFSSREGRRFYRRYRKHLRGADHVARLDRLIWDRHFNSARRALRRVGKDHAALGQARMALARMQGGVDAAIARVPDSLKQHPGLVYERLRWRRRKGRIDDAAELLAVAPKEVSRPALWWRERSFVVRRLLEEGPARLAYQIASDHAQSHGSAYADAEWLSGWIALRFLDDPDAATGHFSALYSSVYYPVSRSRGAYWIGRTAEAKSEPWLAEAWLRTAAQYRDSYYGQLARRRLGEPVGAPTLHDPKPGLGAIARFRHHELARLVEMLGQLGEGDRIDPLILRLDGLSETPEGRYLAGQLAIAQARPDLAVRIARRASRDHIVLPSAGYPVILTPERADAEPALILAMIRQESGFNIAAISRAGARGAMQILPATARHVARSLKVRYSRGRLTRDPVYNVRLGTAYIESLLEAFDGSYIVALAAYNAGPHRARRWLKSLGDPREGRIDSIDWVEMLPFTETRNYIQRVMESLHVYRSRPGEVEIALAPERRSARHPAPATRSKALRRPTRKP